MFGMFGGSLNQYMKAKHGKLPTVEVSRDEFIAALVTSGKTEAEAKKQAKFASILGSEVMVGDRFLKIKEDDSAPSNS